MSFLSAGKCKCGENIDLTCVKCVTPYVIRPWFNDKRETCVMHKPKELGKWVTVKPCKCATVK